jgi:triphosphoribosyl-dephospho-CoA synthetase
MQLPTRIVSKLARPSENGALANANNDVPLALQQAIFEHAVGSVAGPLTTEKGDQVLAVILANHQDKPNISTKALEEIAKKISETMNQLVQARALTLLAEKHPITINPALLAQKPGDAE